MGRELRQGGRGGRRGFTLAEALIACVVLAVATLGIATTVGASYQQSRSMNEESMALGLAQQLLEEIAGKPFLDPNSGLAVDKESGGRTSWDNGSDYDGYTDTTSGLTTLAGDAVTVTSGKSYARSVSVVIKSSPSGSTSATGSFALITVTVQTPTGRRISLSRMASKATIVQ